MRVLAQDVLLAVAAAVALLRGGSWGPVFAFAVVVTALWSIGTLHHPSSVELTDEGVWFSAYGRSHAYLWREVAGVHVRRFLIRDRVLVRLAPTRAWRGRYWLTDGLLGYDVLVRELERRAQSCVEAQGGERLGNARLLPDDGMKRAKEG
jgi:hypothetical protein